MEIPKNILIVEDDRSLGYLLREYLGMKGFEVTWIQKPVEALQVLRTRAFNLVILDVMMPGMDGFSLGREINAEFPELPFIFLTAKSLKVDVLKGFSVGATDYLKKPIDEEELVVRIEALLSRIQKTEILAEPQSLQIGEYFFDIEKQVLKRNGAETHLTSRESELLKFLALRENRLCPHSEILKALWGQNDYFKKKSLNVFITHLRKYLKADPSISIDNIHGQGFILKINKS